MSVNFSDAGPKLLKEFCPPSRLSMLKVLYSKNV